MKYIKKYEQLKKNNPQVGDYVICEDRGDSSATDNLLNFIENNIGQIVDYKEYYGVIPYEVQYIDRPESLKKYFHDDDKVRRYSLSEIKFWSKNKIDLEIILSAKKYNL